MNDKTIKFYRVPGWALNYEVAQSRRVESLNWVPVPANLNSGGYLEIMGEPDGSSIFGAWLAMIQLLAGCNLRGSLIKSNLKPHSIKTISFAIRVPEAAVARMVEVSLSIGWLEEVEIKTELAAFYMAEMVDYWTKLKALKGKTGKAPLYPLNEWETTINRIVSRYEPETAAGLLEEREKKEKREEKEEKERAAAETAAADRSAPPTFKNPTFEEIENHFLWKLGENGGTSDLAREFFVQFGAVDWKIKGSRIDWKSKAGYWIADKKNNIRDIRPEEAAAAAKYLSDALSNANY